MFSSIKEATDSAPFAWIEEGLRSPVGQPSEGDTALRTLDMIPPQFAAYAKILHPIYEDPSKAGESETWHARDQRTTDWNALSDTQRALKVGTLTRTGTGGRVPRRFRRVSWVEVADYLDLEYGPTLTASDMDRAWPGRSWPARLTGPDEGDLPSGQLSAIARAIRDVDRPGPCYFLWWAVACVQVFDRKDVRDYLFRGRLRDLTRFVARKKATSPTYWWPESHAWCVATDWDLCFTVVGGSEDVVARTLASPEVEGLPVAADDALLIYSRKGK